MNISSFKPPTGFWTVFIPGTSIVLLCCILMQCFRPSQSKEQAHDSQIEKEYEDQKGWQLTYQAWLKMHPGINLTYDEWAAAWDHTILIK